MTRKEILIFQLREARNEFLDEEKGRFYVPDRDKILADRIKR